MSPLGKRDYRGLLKRQEKLPKRMFKTVGKLYGVKFMTVTDKFIKFFTNSL